MPEAAAPPLELAFTPSLPAAAALALRDEGTTLGVSCKELPSQLILQCAYVTAATAFLQKPLWICFVQILMHHQAV